MERLATLSDLFALPNPDHWELLSGRLVRKETSGIHGLAHGATAAALGTLSGRGRGWRILMSASLLLGNDLVEPDLLAYRWNRLPEVTHARYLTIPPDWVGEILAPMDAARDLVIKLPLYFQAGIPHYWVLDPVEGTLLTLRRTERAYEVALSARRGQRIRAEPFDAIEISVDELLGEDPPSEPR